MIYPFQLLTILPLRKENCFLKLTFHKLDSFIGFGALSGYIQLLPRFIIEILGLFMQASKILIFIFRFSKINSVRRLLLARIPPTFAAQLIMTSGLKSLIVF